MARHCFELTASSPPPFKLDKKQAICPVGFPILWMRLSSAVEHPLESSSSL
jgi:hypothetical protein